MEIMGLSKWPVRVLNFIVLKLIFAVVISIKSPFIMKNYSIHEIQCHCQYWEMLQEWVCPFVWLLWVPSIFKAEEYLGMWDKAIVPLCLRTSRRMELMLSNRHLLLLGLVKIESRYYRGQLKPIASHHACSVSHSMHSERLYPQKPRDVVLAPNMCRGSFLYE